MQDDENELHTVQCEIAGACLGANIGYASISDLAKHFQIDRRTVPAVLSRFGIKRSPFHKAPRYSWRDILITIDQVPEVFLKKNEVDKMKEPLLTAYEVADALDVSVQTVRNYVAAGRLQKLMLLDRTPRFHPIFCGT